MEKIITLTFIFFFVSSVFSQELKVKNFRHLKNNPSARMSDITDVSGRKCAIIIIKHNIGEFDIDAGIGIEDEKKLNGDTWIWVSPDEYRLVIRKGKPYFPLEYSLKNRLRENEVYELTITITNEYGIIRVNAPQAQIWLDNKPAGKNSFEFNKLKEDKYIVKATRDKYYDEEKFIILNAGDDTLLHFNLKPKLGNLIVNSSKNETSGANVFINDSLIGKTNITVPLIIGRHSLSIEKSYYLPYKQNVLIKENQNTLINAQMEVDPIFYKKRIFLLYNGSLTAPYGLTIGLLGKTGVYVSGRSNLFFDKALYTYNDDETWYNNFTNSEYYIFNDTEKIKRLSITAGLTQQLKRNIFAYIGGGYGLKEIFWEIDLYSYSDDQKTGKEYVLNTENSYSGFESEAGLIFRFSKILMSIGYTNVAFKHSNLTFGFGYNF